MSKLMWPDVRDKASEKLIADYVRGTITVDELVAEMPTDVLLTHHGAYGMGFFHVGAYLGENVMVEFNRKRGFFASTLADSFLLRSLRDAQKCADTKSQPIIRVYHPSHTITSTTSSPLKCNLPAHATKGERIAWLESNVSACDYDLIHFNCEHVARYVLTGQAQCVQVHYAVGHGQHATLLFLVIVLLLLLIHRLPSEPLRLFVRPPKYAH